MGSSLSESVLAGTAAVSLRGRVLRTGVFVVGHWTVSVHTFIHFFTYHIHQTLKNLLHVDVVFGAGLEKLKTWRNQKKSRTVSMPGLL